MTIIRPTTINARFSQPVGLGGEKLWLCPTLGGDRLDLSGNGNHGTYYGGMGTVVSKYRGTKAFLFDGSNTQRIECDPQVIGKEPVFSVSCWVYVNQHDASYGEGFVSQFGAGNNSATCKFSLATVAPSSSITAIGWIRPSTSNVAAASSESFEAQTWHHLCFMADGSKIFTYLDGFLRGTNTYSGTVRTVTNPLVIGTYNQLINQNHYLNGMVDDVRAYSRVLSPTEIKHLASYRGVLGSPRKPYDPFKRTVVRVPAAIPTSTKVGSIKKPTTISKPSYQSGYARNASESENPNLWDGLVGAWMPSLGVTGETLRDVSGNGNHGTLTNTNWEISSARKSVAYNGSTSKADIGSNNKFELQEMSACIWFKINSVNLSNYTHIFWKKKNSSPFSSFGLWIEQSTRNIYGGFGQFHESTGSQLPLNEWVFASLTYDGYFRRIFVNGLLDVEASDSSLTIQYDSNPIQIGFGDYNLEFNGAVSSASIYNRALSPQEIKHLYVDSLAPFRKKQRVSVAVPAAVTPSATYHPLRSLAHPLEQ